MTQIAFHLTDIKSELGITHAVHSRKCTRFPWQLFLHGGLCVLVDARATHHVVICSSYCEADDGPLRVPVQAIPIDVLDQVRHARQVRL